MKVVIKKDEVFKPVHLNIVFESQDEIDALMCVVGNNTIVFDAVTKYSPSKAGYWDVWNRLSAAILNSIKTI